MTIKHPRILAIDDTPANLIALGSALEGEFELQCADSCAVGLAQALEDPPDLILLDVMMPDVDGYETLRRIKAQRKQLRLKMALALADKAQAAPIVVATVPAQTLAQRPDVLAAEREVVVASVEVGVAQAQRYPRLSLGGSIGQLRYASEAAEVAHGSCTDVPPARK